MSASVSAEEALLKAVLERPMAQRNSYLKRTCGDDSDLRRRVEERLAARDMCGGSTSQQAEGAEEDEETLHLEHDVQPVHEQIDRYRLLNVIGSGGFGSVWHAEQKGPVPRRVALKVVKPGMDTREVIAQFEAERQLLALMDHPCIAKVYDAGGPAKGCPIL